jgi:glycosyltransferase involved in cell wall biosynthesis
MKILMVLDHDFPHDHRVEKEIESLTENNHEIILACLNYQTKNPLFEDKGNYKIYRKNISKFIFKSSVAVLKLPFYFKFWEKFVFEILKKEQIDAVHIHDLPLVKIGVKIKSKLNIPLIVDLHENWPASLETAIHTNTFLGKVLSSNKQWRKYEKNILIHADSIITVVDEMKDRISKLGIDEKNIFIVSNTISTKDFPISNKKPNPDLITLFYAGGINIHRGLQIVIKALSLLIKETPNVNFNIIGSGSYQNHLENLVVRLNLENNVHFLGWKNLEEISKYLAQADIALIPHLKSEQTDCSSPNKLYQYIYAKKPILTSNCNSLVRVVNETKSGISYIHNSPEDFKRAFNELIINRDNILDLEFGLNMINTKYNWSIDSKRLINLYSKFI